MDVIYSLIPSMMFFGLIFFAVLIWAVKKGQYEDMEGNASRILMEDDDYDEWMDNQPIVPSDRVVADPSSIPKAGTAVKHE
ncbi:MAG: cbb3-type cytochrome oxidase assembly protein CcoS [Gallionella sp.]